MGEFGYPRFVQQPVTRPHHCAFIPFLGGSNSKGFFDSGTDYWGERIYASVEAVEDMAGQLGWVAPGAVADLEDRVVRAEAEAEQLRARVAELEEFQAAFAVVKAAGGDLKRRPGRPKTKETA